MIIDANAIDEFKNLYNTEYGVTLSNKEATVMFNKLINLVRAVYGKNLPTKKMVQEVSIKQ